MKEFFHGWRRKAGLVILVVACFVMGLWVRSYVIEDEFWYAEHDGGGPHFALIAVSHAGVSWWSWQEAPGRQDFPRSQWRSFPVQSNGEMDVFNSRKRSVSYLQTRREFREWHVPLWPFAVFTILPLTSLAAYLIVWQPRKAK